MAYGIALFYAMKKYRYYYESSLKYFPLIIGYTLASEIMGYMVAEYDDIQLIYLNNHLYARYNHLLYNIFDVVFFLYFFYIFWKIIDVPKYRRIINYCVILFVATSLINPLFQNILILPQLMAITMGSVSLIACIAFYFKTLQSKKESKLHHNNLLFWISIGLLAFYPIYPFIMFLGFHYEIYVKYHIRLVQHTTIVLMYSCFIIGFLRLRRRIEV